MKRFYTLVSLTATPEGHAVCLDGKPIKTPMRHILKTPNLKLAQTLQKEWAEQGEEVIPAEMPFTQILSTAIDRIIGREDEAAEEIIRYFHSDLLYFRAGKPPELIPHQESVWGPWFDWAQERFGPLPKPTTTLSVPPMPQQTAEAFAAYVRGLDPLRLCVLSIMTGATGSAILAAAVLARAISMEQVLDAVFCEEFFFVDFYDIAHNGPDPMQEKKQAAIRADIEACAAFLMTID